MTSPRYPLQVVMDQRQRALDDAQQEVAASLTALADAERTLADAEAERHVAAAALADAEARLYEPEADGTLGVHVVAERRAGIAHRRRAMAVHDDAVASARGGVERAQAAVEAARARLTEAARSKKALDKHHEGWLAEVRAEAARKEEALIAEVANAAWVRRSQEEGP